MNGIDTFLIQYGLAAVFLIMFVKSVGVPIPIPADLVILSAAVRVAQGKLVGWQVFVAIFIALLLGGLIQYILARGPGRGILYRFGRYIGLTEARLEAASRRVKKGSIAGLAIAMLIPGVRGAAMVASGLADVSLRSYLIGLALGSIAFESLHFFLGYVGGSALVAFERFVPSPLVIILVLALLVIVYALWVIAVRRQKAARAKMEAAQSDAAALEVWHEGICPICLALYTASQIRVFDSQYPI
jgi:membrane protein DedA with SNARE-associated domain